MQVTGIVCIESKVYNNMLCIRADIYTLIMIFMGITN